MGGVDSRGMHWFMSKNLKEEPLFSEYLAICAQDDRVLASVLSSSRACLELWSDPDVCRLTASDNVALEDLRKERTVVYLVVPEHQVRYFSIVLNLCEEVLNVLDRAMRGYGCPRHLVSDQGAQYTAEVFRETLAALGIKQRFGAIGQYGSIAIIERFWRTLKQLLGVRLRAPISGEHLEHRLRLVTAYYAMARPHQGLGGATPAGVLLGEQPAAARAIRPPRVGLRQPPGDMPLPLEVVYLDRERRLPVLVPAERAA